QLVMEALKRNSIPNDWIPKGKVHLYNCFTDRYVNTTCGDTLYENLKEKGAEVEYFYQDVTHEQMIVHMVIDFYKHLYPDKAFDIF
ncbi:MAG: hypothetical protein QM237_01980, partial [Bacteroidota bacterium]|nr:hypothetical protein [Bacteroidota bacterium]